MALPPIPAYKDRRFWQAVGMGALTTLAVVLLAVLEASTGRLLYTLSFFSVLPVGPATFGALAASGLGGWLIYRKTKPVRAHYIAASVLGAVALPLCYVAVYETLHVDAPYEAKALKAELESLRDKSKSQRREVERLAGEVGIVRAGLGKLAGGGRSLIEYSRLCVLRDKTFADYRSALEQYNAYGLGAGSFADKRALELKAEADKLRQALERTETEMAAFGGRLKDASGKTPSLTEAARAVEEHDKLVGQLRVVRADYEETWRRLTEGSLDYRPMTGKYELNQGFRGEHISAFLRRTRGAPYSLKSYLRESFRARTWSILATASRVVPSPPAGPAPARARFFLVMETLGFVAGAVGLVLFIERKYFVMELIRCGGCGKTLRVPTWKGGIRVRCPGCQRETVLVQEAEKKQHQATTGPGNKDEKEESE